MLPDPACQESAPIRSRSSKRHRPRHPQNRRLHDLVNAKAKGRDALCTSEAIHRAENDATAWTQRRNRAIPARRDRPESPQTGQIGAPASPRMSGTGNRLTFDARQNASNADFFNSIRGDRTLEIHVRTYMRTHKFPKPEARRGGEI